MFSNFLFNTEAKKKSINKHAEYSPLLISKEHSSCPSGSGFLRISKKKSF